MVDSDTGEVFANSRPLSLDSVHMQDVMNKWCASLLRGVDKHETLCLEFRVSSHDVPVQQSLGEEFSIVNHRGKVCVLKQG